MSRKWHYYGFGQLRPQRIILIRCGLALAIALLVLGSLPIRTVTVEQHCQYSILGGHGACVPVEYEWSRPGPVVQFFSVTLPHTAQLFAHDSGIRLVGLGEWLKKIGYALQYNSRP